MAHADAGTVAQHWADRLNQSGQKITDGVNATKVAPGQLAAKQLNAYLANIQARAQVWAARTGAVSLSAWQSAMTTKGVPRIGQGATASVPKMAQFLGKLLPYVDSGRSSLPARGSYAQNVARMTQWADYMHKFVR